ncbi:MAG: isochorismatase [Syntrophobacteraceae bacterium]
MRELPVPPHFAPEKVGEVWRTDYQKRALEAEKWAITHSIEPASSDQTRIALLLVDVQNSFCIPGFELFVAGGSGTGAVDDNRRLCEFLYRNLRRISLIIATMDTHQAMQIFHSIFFIDEKGEHPGPFSLITVEDIERGRFKPNPEVLKNLGIAPDYASAYLRHYTKTLRSGGKYDLTIWPYHAMLGGIGHALASAVEEAIFFHSMARFTQPQFRIKGQNPLTEHFSVLGPEVTHGPQGEVVAKKDVSLIEELAGFDAVLIAGQAKSHCVAWTIADLLEDSQNREGELARKIYLLEDCTSPVVIPGVVDYTEPAERAFRRFAKAGMRVVRSVDPMDSWIEAGGLLST